MTWSMISQPCTARPMSWITTASATRAAVTGFPGFSVTGRNGLCRISSARSSREKACGGSMTAVCSCSLERIPQRRDVFSGCGTAYSGRAVRACVSSSRIPSGRRPRGRLICGCPYCRERTGLSSWPCCAVFWRLGPAWTGISRQSTRSAWRNCVSLW